MKTKVLKCEKINLCKQNFYLDNGRGKSSKLANSVSRTFPSSNSSSTAGARAVAGNLISQLLANDPVFNPRARRGRGGGSRGRKKNASALSDLGLEVGEEEEDETILSSQGKRKNNREYVPKIRSGAYAVLITLYVESRVRWFLFR